MKSNTEFDEFTAEYDAWFDRHPEIYQSELLAMKQAVPQNQTGIEIGKPINQRQLLDIRLKNQSASQNEIETLINES